MATIVSYDAEHDILAIHKGFARDEAFKGNLDVGNLVLDLSTKGNVRGLEILDASGFLADFGVSEETLRELKHADFSAETRAGAIVLNLKLDGIPAKIAVAAPGR